MLPKKLLYLIALITIIIGTGCSGQSGLKAGKVWDGDSFLLNNGIEVRLIGINAPEKDQLGSDQARSFLQGLLAGKELRIEKGVEERDKYNRLLCYVYAGSPRLGGAGDTFINAEMIKNGYAVTLFYPLNDKYQSEFIQLEIIAKETKKGLWATGGLMQSPKVSETPSGDVILYQDAGKYYGLVKTVEGKIIATHNSGKACFLRFHPDYKANHFYLQIFPENYYKFPAPPEKVYLDKKIRVRGVIKKYKGNPEIIVKDPSQIEIIKE